jgi:hypothetical protein
MDSIQSVTKRAPVFPFDYSSEKIFTPTDMDRSVGVFRDALRYNQSSRPAILNHPTPPDTESWISPCKRTIQQIWKVYKKHFKSHKIRSSSTTNSFLAGANKSATELELEKWTSDVQEALLIVVTSQEHDVSFSPVRETTAESHPVFELDATTVKTPVFELESFSKVELAFEFDSPPGPVTTFQLDSKYIRENEAISHTSDVERLPPPQTCPSFTQQPRGLPYLAVPTNLYHLRKLRSPLHNVCYQEPHFYIPVKVSSVSALAKSSLIPELVLTFEGSNNGLWAVPPHVGEITS